MGHCSYSTIEAWMEDVLQVPVSRGYLAKLCTGTIAASLSDSYDEVVTMIPHQDQLGSDETSIKDNGKKHWIWCITAATFTVFRIAKTRSREVLEQLVGPEFTGYMNFDYFSADCSFVWNYWIKAQYCWAHLIRDRFLELVRQAPATKEAQNLAARFEIVAYMSEETSRVETYDLSEDYFRFMFTPGLEPTNNHNEQQLRHSVIDRKITQGTRSEAGQRYHERMWTAIATCKKQNRNFFSFLYDSIVAHLHQQPAPSLLGK
jgi:transposase